jgi:hypothetical protein
VEYLACALIGFSLITALLLAAAYHSVYSDITQSALSRAAGNAMLLGFFTLQILHWRYLVAEANIAGTIIDSRSYCLLLSANAAALYWFFLGLLRPVDFKLAWFELAIPTLALIMSLLLPGQIAVPLAFVFGIFYAAHLANLVHRLRVQRRWFRLELRVFIVFAVIAVGVLIAGLAAIWMGMRLFVISYSILIGCGFALMLYLLLRFPDVLGVCKLDCTDGGHLGCASSV